MWTTKQSFAKQWALTKKRKQVNYNFFCQKNSFVFNSVIWNANHPYFNTKFQIMLINELKRYFFQWFVWVFFFFFWNPTKFIISILYLCWVRMTKNRVKHFAHFFWRSSFFLWEQKTYHDYFRSIERLRVWEKCQIFSPYGPQ